jgi:hypothetical protein
MADDWVHGGRARPRHPAARELREPERQEPQADGLHGGKPHARAHPAPRQGGEPLRVTLRVTLRAFPPSTTNPHEPPWLPGDKADRAYVLHASAEMVGELVGHLLARRKKNPAAAAGVTKTALELGKQNEHFKVTVCVDTVIPHSACAVCTVRSALPPTTTNPLPPPPPCLPPPS